jgi:glycosyltransferase involved in cell wall biosynthesis
MKIAQIVVPGASEYERKSQRVDFAALSEAGHQVAVYQSPEVVADVAHVYGKVKRVRMPHVIDAKLQLPEAVEDQYWTTNDQQRTTNVLGTYARKSIQNAIEQTYVRLTRTRDDIEWRLFERPPTPPELAEIAVWVDPALTDDDRDGFVAEALVAGNVVVAARTTINVQRLEKGRTGFLVRPNDPNELTHAILAALFKSELGQIKISAARQTISKFRPRQRLRALMPIYESLLR